MNKLDAFCLAIQEYEGWRPGTRAYRNCNPGNLRFSPMQDHNEDGYACFNTFAQGWAALLYDVRSKATGHTRTGLGPGSTIEDFFRVYAPAEDKNHPLDYADFVARRAGLQITDTLDTLLDGGTA